MPPKNPHLFPKNSPPRSGEMLGNAPEKLAEFRDRLVSGEQSPELLQAGYVMARALGDEALNRPDRPRVEEILGLTYEAAMPQHFVVTGEGNDTRDVASFHELDSQLTVDGERGLTAYATQALFEPAGVKPRSLGDSQLTRTLYIIAHEAAHAMLAGIGNQSRQGIGAKWRAMHATRMYLARHPKEGITATWKSDVPIHEQRFAEGYARLTANAVLKELGYEPAERDAAMAELAAEMRTPTWGEAGANQIDYVSKSDPTKSLIELVDSNDKKLTNPGALGYEIPLSPEQLIEQLDELAVLCQARYRPPVENPVRWQQQVQRHRSTENTAYLKTLRKRRRHELQGTNLVSRMLPVKLILN